MEQALTTPQTCSVKREQSVDGDTTNIPTHASNSGDQQTTAASNTDESTQSALSKCSRASSSLNCDSKISYDNQSKESSSQAQPASSSVPADNSCQSKAAASVEQAAAAPLPGVGGGSKMREIRERAKLRRQLVAQQVIQ